MIGASIHSVAEEVNVAGIKCVHCAEEHAEGTKFCSKTGKSLEAPARAPVAKTMMLFQSPAAPIPGAQPARPASATLVMGSAGVDVSVAAGAPTPATKAIEPPTAAAAVVAPVAPAPAAAAFASPEAAPAPAAAPRVSPASDPADPRASAALPDWARPDTADRAAADEAGTATPGPGWAWTPPAPDAPALEVGQLLGQAWALYQAHLKAFLITAAILYVPASIVTSLLVAVVIMPMVLGAALGAGPAVGLVGILAGGLVTLVVSIVMWGTVIPLTQGAVTVAVADRILGGGGSWRDHWGLLGRRLGRFLSALIPAAIITGIGVLLLFIPGLLAMFFFSFVPFVVLFEGTGGVAALKRSFELVKSDWLRVAIVLVVFGILNAVAHWLGNLFVPASSLWLGRILGDLLTLVLMPFPILGATLLYLDVRRRAEHLDRTALLEQLAAARSSD